MVIQFSARAPLRQSPICSQMSSPNLVSIFCTLHHVNTDINRPLGCQIWSWHPVPLIIEKVFILLNNQFRCPSILFSLETFVDSCIFWKLMAKKSLVGKKFHAAMKTVICWRQRRNSSFSLKCEDLEVWDFCLSSTVDIDTYLLAGLQVQPRPLPWCPLTSPHTSHLLLTWEAEAFSLLFREGLFLVSSKRNLRRPTVWASPAGTVNSRWVWETAESISVFKDIKEL